MDKATLLSCKGYDPKFINNNNALSLSKVLPQRFKDELPEVEGAKDKILRYTSLSVLYNRSRMLPFVAAYNIDGSQKQGLIKRTHFRRDPRIDAEAQLSHDFYDLEKGFTEFEIGHMGANNELAWGPKSQTQAYQTFHFPNSVPQAENLNTGIWKSLESYIIKEASSAVNQKICVFTGPIQSDKDPYYINKRDFQVPLLFFKVIVFEHEKILYSTAFIMSHEEKLREDKLLVKTAARRGAAKAETAMAFQDFPYKKVYQVNVPEVEKLSGMSFSWKGVRAIKIADDKNEVKVKASKPKKSVRTSRGGTEQSTDSSRVSTLILPF